MPAPSEAEREEIEKKAIEKEIEELQSKLSRWPPERKSHVINSIETRQPVRVQLKEPHADSYFEHTHYSVKRLTFKPPPAIVDQYGLPKRRPLDCMIRYFQFSPNFNLKSFFLTNSSYQWDKQELVHAVYDDLNMHRVQTWFDIRGFMQGCTNDAMATGWFISR